MPVAPDHSPGDPRLGRMEAVAAEYRVYLAFIARRPPSYELGLYAIAVCRSARDFGGMVFPRQVTAVVAWQIGHRFRHLAEFIVVCRRAWQRVRHLRRPTHWGDARPVIS